MSFDPVQDSQQETAADFDQRLHQLNQPLTAIGNYAEAGCRFIDQGLEDPARLRQIFEKIVQQSERARTLAHEIRQSAPGAGNA
jgi:Signal transduction histidine kinase regulating C4-dicarboxylate transport system